LEVGQPACTEPSKAAPALRGGCSPAGVARRGRDTRGRTAAVLLARAQSNGVGAHRAAGCRAGVGATPLRPRRAAEPSSEAGQPACPAAGGAASPSEAGQPACIEPPCSRARAVEDPRPNSGIRTDGCVGYARRTCALWRPPLAR
jgi:hypothetical protein